MDNKERALEMYKELEKRREEDRKLEILKKKRWKAIFAANGNSLGNSASPRQKEDLNE